MNEHYDLYSGHAISNRRVHEHFIALRFLGQNRPHEKMNKIYISMKSKKGKYK